MNIRNASESGGTKRAEALVLRINCRCKLPIWQRGHSTSLYRYSKHILGLFTADHFRLFPPSLVWRVGFPNKFVGVIDRALKSRTGEMGVAKGV